MLVRFAVQNYKTFKEKAILNLVSSKYDKETRVKENLVNLDKYKFGVLKSAVVYGANASGKSKFFEALFFMRRFVITSSAESQKGDLIPVEAFRLSTETEHEPSEFEVSFVYENVLYRYGFEVNKNVVVAEWLFHKPKTKEVELFYRDHQKFEVHARNFKKGAFAVREGMVRDNSLLISLAAQLNDTTAIAVVDWFKKLKTISGLKEEGYRGFTMGQTKDPKIKFKILELLKAADLGIQDFKLKMVNAEHLDIPDELRELLIKAAGDDDPEFVADVLTIHKKYNADNQFAAAINFSLEEDESSGTQKFFALAGPVLNVLKNGYTLIVDELDSKLHPNLVCKIISLFNSKDSNPENAQLIFNTHNTNLLSSGLFRRDQIWFTEKDKFGAGRLFSLADFKSTDVRKTEAFEENYIRGKYGAVPFLGFFDGLNYQKLMLQNEDEK